MILCAGIMEEHHEPKLITGKQFRLANSAKKPQYVHITDLWHPTRNPPLSDSLGTQSNRKVLFKKYCGRHYAYQTLRSFLNGAGMAWHNCKVCKRYQSNKRKQPWPSKSESEAYEVLAEEFTELKDDAWVVETKVVPDWCGAVDIYLLDQNVAVQVDGASHFDASVHKQSKSKQKKTDLDFCRHACKSCHVLRLHYHDIPDLHYYVRKMLEVAKQTDSNVVAFSKTYHTECLVTQADLDSIHCIVLSEEDCEA